MEIGGRVSKKPGGLVANPLKRGVKDSRPPWEKLWIPPYGGEPWRYPLVG